MGHFFNHGESLPPLSSLLTTILNDPSEHHGLQFSSGALFVTHQEPLHIGRGWCVAVCPPAPRSLHRALYPSVLTSVGPFLLAHFVQFSVLPLQCFTHCPPLQLHGIFLPFIVSPSLLLYSTNISYIHVLFCLILVHHFQSRKRL